MTVSHSLPLPIASRANCRVVLARSSRSADAYLLLCDGNARRAGGLFFQLVAGLSHLGVMPRLTVVGARKTVAFHAIENALCHLAKPFRGGPLTFSILHFPSLDRSSLNAIKHEEPGCFSRNSGNFHNRGTV